MNSPLITLSRLTNPTLKYPPALYRQPTTYHITTKPENHVLNTINKRNINTHSYKNTIGGCYSININTYTRNRHSLMHIRALSYPAPGDNLPEKTEYKPSVELVEEVPKASHEEDDWTDEMQWIRSQEIESVLLPPKDISDIDVLAPELRPSFNLAAYANQSATLQELIKLGVDLSTWDGRKNVSSFILPLDFERDIKPYIIFLHDVGVAADDLGKWLTVNPYILKVNIDNLQTRINYLEAMKFNQEQIARVISKNPYWLLFSTVKIDERLGFFQGHFGLTDDEVRYLTTKQSRVITIKFDKLKMTTFSVLEEMGFEKSEVKTLLLAKPKIWMAHRESLLRRFDFAHNHMGLTHQQILQFPQVFMTREFRMRQRHAFLKLLGRAQYDPSKPNYVSPKALVSDTDAEFCFTVARSSVQTYNDFLKTM